MVHLPPQIMTIEELTSLQKEMRKTAHDEPHCNVSPHNLLMIEALILEHLRKVSEYLEQVDEDQKRDMAGKPAQVIPPPAPASTLQAFVETHAQQTATDPVIPETEPQSAAPVQSA